jgi:type IV pilus assembly protein PilO
MAKNNTPGNKLAPFFQNLEKLTKPQRMGIYAATLIVIVSLSVWFLLMPKHQKIALLDKELQQVQQELAVAKKNASELNDWRNKMKQKEAQYKTVTRALPEKEEIPTLLAGISQAGKDAGLDFILFQPKPESAKDFYAEIPVDISVSGTYHQVAVFFDKVSNLPRIVNIRDIRMAPASSKEDGGGMLTTSCQAVTYKFIENSGTKKKSRRTGRNG